MHTSCFKGWKDFFFFFMEKNLNISPLEANVFRGYRSASLKCQNCSNVLILTSIWMMLCCKFDVMVYFCRKVPLAAESLASSSLSPSDSSSSSLGVLSSPLFASPAAPASLEGVSVVSYSTAFPHNGGGIFCIRDPDPPTSATSSSSAKAPRTKPAKSPRAQSEGPGAKRRKPSEGSSHRKNGNGYHPPPPPLPPPSGPAVMSNGTATLCIKSKPPGRIGQGLKDAGRYASAGQVGAGSSIPGDHALSSHGPGPFATVAMDGRKRKSSGSGEKSGKVTKTTALDGIFRKSSLSLLAPLPESAHNPHLRQVNLDHACLLLVVVFYQRVRFTPITNMISI